MEAKRKGVDPLWSRRYSATEGDDEVPAFLSHRCPSSSCPSR